MPDYSIYTKFLSELKKESRFRHIPEEPAPGMIDLTTNDYMGLAADPISLEPFTEGFPKSLQEEYKKIDVEISSGNLLSKTSSASRLLSPHQRVFNLLERFLESDYGKPALLFNSGYHANMGGIGGINLPGTKFYVDKLMHASAIDALFACRADFTRFPHNDIERLARMLERDDSSVQKVIVTESVFSMDGDRGRLRQLTELRRRLPNVLLYVDEAHGFGCFGRRGLGLAEEEGLLNDIDILIGTFGKAAASAGAFIIAPPPIHDTLINNSRSFIFSTALPPSVVWTSLTNYLRLRGASERRARLKRLSAEVASTLGIVRDDGGSQILPFMTGSAEKAVALAALWRERGIMVLPIRRPTVPPGGERIRISLSATLPESVLEEIGKVAGSVRQ